MRVFTPPIGLLPVAFELGIGNSMVKAHVFEIMRKRGVRNRTQVALCASALDFDRVGM